MHECTFLDPDILNLKTMDTNKADFSTTTSEQNKTEQNRLRYSDNYL
jgi:hypothetical protein